MELTARKYKGSLGDREAFLVRALAEEDKAIFKIGDAPAPTLASTVTRAALPLGSFACYVGL